MIPTKSKATKKLKFTSQDRGGPREQEAHREETTFEVMVRDDGRGGYWVNDPDNDSRITGSLRDKKGRILKPVLRNMRLRHIDDVAYAIESKDKNLDIIRRERQLIEEFRRQGYNDPFAAMETRLEAELVVWDEAVKLGVSPSDYVDADLQGVSTSELQSAGTYKLKPFIRMGMPAKQHTASDEARGRKRKGRDPMGGTDA